MSVMDSYWAYRKAKMRLKRPELAFLEMMFGMVNSKTGERTTFFQGVKGMYQLGKYHQQQNMDSLRRMMARLWPKNDFDTRGEQLSDAEWENLGKAKEEGGPNRSEAGADKGPDPAPRPVFGDEAKEAGLSVVPPGRAWRTGEDPNFRAWITPDRAGSKVASEEVPAERRIPVFDGSWPVKGPGGRRRGETSELAIAAARGETAKTAPLMLESPDAVATRDKEIRARDVQARARRRLTEINGEAPEAGPAEKGADERLSRVREQARRKAERRPDPDPSRKADRGSER